MIFASDNTVLIKAGIIFDGIFKGTILLYYLIDCMFDFTNKLLLLELNSWEAIKEGWNGLLDLVRIVKLLLKLLDGEGCDRAS